ncbi:MAG: hypothetical protein KDD82_16735, partial [Planctomycetes bacterium]|nr:hypothetical protein [Planctomycetota bacterium]
WLPVDPRLERALACRSLGRWAQALYDADHVASRADGLLADYVRAEVHAQARARAKALGALPSLELAQRYERVELALALPELELPWLDDLTGIASFGVDARRRALSLSAGLRSLEELGARLEDPSSTREVRALAMTYLARYESAWQLQEELRREFAARDDRRGCDPLLKQARIDALLELRPELVERVQAAIDLAYRFPAAIAFKGELLRRLARYREAVSACSQALELKPDLVASSELFPLLDRALAYEQLGERDLALRDARRLLELGDLRRAEGEQLLRRLGAR